MGDSRMLGSSNYGTSNYYSTKKRKGSGCGTLFIIVIALILVRAYIESGSCSFSGVERRTANVQVVQDGSEMPDDATFIGLLDDTLAATTGEGTDSSTQSGRSELMQALYDMEPSFYTDSIAELRSDAGIPASVFWVESTTWWSYYTADGELDYYRVEVTYRCTKEERDRMQLEVDAAANEILAQVPWDADAWTKALAVHDELVKRVEYDHTFSWVHRYDIYGALVEHVAVCEGYAKAFEYLMGKLGEEAYFDATKYDPNDTSGGHSWNYMYDAVGKYYIDVTWDDPDAADKYGRQYIQYDYFGVTAVELTRVESHDGTVYDDNTAPYSNASYHVKNGYFLWYYDRDSLTDVFGRQYRAGSNVLTVKFASQTAFEDAMYTLCGPGWRDWDDVDTTELRTVLKSVISPDFNDMLYIVFDEGLYVLNVRLDCE